MASAGNPIREFGLLYSRFCNAACLHCGSNSSPAARGRMPFAYVESILPDAAAAGADSVIISGGEPLAFFEDICRITELARETGLATHVCSNGFWGDRPERARRWLAELQARGLELLMLSTDQFHLADVPLSSVIGAANVAEELGVPCQIAVPTSARDWRGSGLLAELQRSTAAHVYTHPVHPVGRGEQLPPHHFRWRPLEIGPCHLVGHVEVDYDGTVSVCPTSADFARESPLILGNVGQQRLSALLARFQTTPLYRVIAELGPLGLYALLTGRTDPRGIGLGDRLHDCHLCRFLNRDGTLAERFEAETGLALLEPVDDATFADVMARAVELVSATASGERTDAQGVVEIEAVAAPDPSHGAGPDSCAASVPAGTPGPDVPVGRRLPLLPQP